MTTAEGGAPTGGEPDRAGEYPLRFHVDYPDRPLNRLTTLLRLIVVIPVGIVLATVNGGGLTWVWDRGWVTGGWLWHQVWGTDSWVVYRDWQVESPVWTAYWDGTVVPGPDWPGYWVLAGAGGLLFFGPLLMILFRQKYPRWWFDWNLNLFRFQNRVSVYLALLRDEYPSTDEEQAVHLDIDYPDVPRDLNRWLPLVKWLLAIPHYILLFFLNIALVIAAIIAWFAILFTGRYPSGLFGFVVGVLRWNNRVTAYAFLLFTDRYPPFRLS
ncbi:hypothetical protein GCM10012275_49410 [Longimycelium tulufanense]|uniref:DUF4389 domain-containing protein n=1 Tax=Longimycelium tulufanense TaxID=907463 RepID=A0A8J3CIS4_9PSEU|nr:DUF4389 domain-containing protein [Longimycelium tulufanense]GGM72896.1 hypothetical protein GCM10012275_49410 [Longimycelium tulufanense]